MADFEDVRVEHIYSFDDEAIRKESELLGEPVDEAEYRGINPEIITSLLDTIGARGDNPTMATILYHAGVEKPLRSRSELYGEYSLYAFGGSHALALFGVYIDGDLLRRNSVPDALLLTEGFNRKAYRGFELVVTDLWVNPESPRAIDNERVLRDKAQADMLSGDSYSDYIFVEQGTVIHEMDEDEGKTLEALGIKPEDYGGGEPARAWYDRMAKIGDVFPEGKNYELLHKLQALYASLKPDVDKIGFEGEELYELRLNESEITRLNNLMDFEGIDRITGLSIDREDRPPGQLFECNHGDGCMGYYSNGWGDMTIVIHVEREGIATAYTQTVFMEGPGETWLRKRTMEVEEFSDQVSKDAAHLLSLMEDPMDKATKLNDIDEFEYASLVKLIRNVQAVTTLS